MGGRWVDALDEVVDRKLSDLRWVQVLAEVRQNLRRGFYPEWIVDSIFQNENSSLSYSDAYAFLQIWADIKNGVVTVTPISVGSEPNADILLGLNREALSFLPEPFRAEPDNPKGGGVPRDDGLLLWTSDISVKQNKPEGADDVILPPGQVSLEIGTTSSMKSLMQIRMAGLARWPYGHKRIALFNCLKPFDPIKGVRLRRRT